MDNIQTTRFTRKSFEVDGIQVTADNMNDVARWTNGKIHMDAKKRPYVKVPVLRPTSERLTMAYEGNWVLYVADSGFKVYSQTAFEASFEPISPSKTEPPEEKSASEDGKAVEVEGKDALRVLAESNIALSKIILNQQKAG